MPPLKIDLEIEIAAPPERVWQVFSTPENMQEWMRLSGYLPEVGANYQMDVSTPEGAFIFTGEVKVFDPPRELAFTWVQQEVGKDPWPVDTLVTLRLTHRLRVRMCA